MDRRAEGQVAISKACCREGLHNDAYIRSESDFGRMKRGRRQSRVANYLRGGWAGGEDEGELRPEGRTTLLLLLRTGDVQMSGRPMPVLVHGTSRGVAEVEGEVEALFEAEAGAEEDGMVEKIGKLRRLCLASQRVMTLRLRLPSRPLSPHKVLRVLEVTTHPRTHLALRTNPRTAQARILTLMTQRASQFSRSRIAPLP
jgi:hypothetical protein